MNLPRLKRLWRRVRRRDELTWNEIVEFLVGPES